MLYLLEMLILSFISCELSAFGCCCKTDLGYVVKT